MSSGPFGGTMGALLFSGYQFHLSTIRATLERLKVSNGLNAQGLSYSRTAQLCWAWLVPKVTGKGKIVRGQYKAMIKHITILGRMNDINVQISMDVEYDNSLVSGIDVINDI